MKKLTLIGILLILLIALTGCSNNGENNEAGVTELINSHETGVDEQKENEIPMACSQPDALVFSSLEDFLLAHQALQLGGDITAFVDQWYGEVSGSTLESVTEGSKFASLKTLFLPVGIPDDYKIGVIWVNEEMLEIDFFHVDDMVSEESMRRANIQQRHFSLTILNRDNDEATLFSNMMKESGAFEENLVDGRYLFRSPNSFHWVADGARFIFRVPLRQLNERDVSVVATEIDGISLDAPHEMIAFVETMTVNLQDENEVMTLIRELRQGNQGGR